MVERYRKRHLAAQVRSTNGLRGIFKFSEILGSTSYTLYVHQINILFQIFFMYCLIERSCCTCHHLNHMIDLHDIWHRRFMLKTVEYLILVQSGLMVLNNILLKAYIIWCQHFWEQPVGRSRRRWINNINM
jgi:hypothetical protein